jgi:hypothetical protein
MNMKPTTLTPLALAASLLSGAFLLNIHPAEAQNDSAPSTTATRPAKTPTGQTGKTHHKLTKNNPVGSISFSRQHRTASEMR